MKFDFSEATKSPHELLRGVSDRRPYAVHRRPFVLFVMDQTEETDGDRSRQREGWPGGTGAVPKSRSVAAAIEGAVKAQPQNDSAAER